MRTLLLSMSILIYGVAAADTPDATPVIVQMPDGTMRLSTATIASVSGLPYVCFAPDPQPVKLLCFVIQPDGEVLAITVTSDAVRS